MKKGDLKLLSLLTLLLLSNLAFLGGTLADFLLNPEAKCKCLEDGSQPDATKARVELTPSTISLSQGGSTSAVLAKFFVGSNNQAASWSASNPAEKLLKEAFPTTGLGTQTNIQVAAQDTVIQDENWTKGNTKEVTTVTIFGKGSGNAGQGTLATAANEAQAVLTISIFGTQLNWVNKDGQKPTWWNTFEGSKPKPWKNLADGGETVTYYLKLNTPGPISTDQWDFKVNLKKLKVETFVDSFIPGYSPFSYENDPNQYVSPPQVTIENGLIKITFTSVADYPEWPFSGKTASLPFEVVATHKQENFSVRQDGGVSMSESATTDN